MRKYGLVVLAILIMAPAVFAQTPQTANGTIQANVINNCRIVWAGINFGNYDPVIANSATGSHLDNTGTISVFCTKGKGFTSVALNDGGQPVAANGIRQMSDGAATPQLLQYELYLDNAHSTRWGSSGANLKTSATLSTDHRLAIDGGYTVYGRVFRDQNVSAAAFTDTVTATVNF